LQQRRLRDAEAQIERELPRRNARDVCSVGALQRPVADVHVRARRAGFREAEARARRPLVVAQPGEARVRQCRMGEQQLARCEAARALRARRRAMTEERDLHAKRRVIVAAQPSRDIPPFRSVLGMRTEIAREGQRAAVLHRCVGRALRLDMTRECERAGGKEKIAAAHVTSPRARRARDRRSSRCAR
jgi:hypothetical protein